MSCAPGRIHTGTTNIVCLMEGESLSADHDMSEKCKCTSTDNTTVTVCHAIGYIHRIRQSYSAGLHACTHMVASMNQV